MLARVHVLCMKNKRVEGGRGGGGGKNRIMNQIVNGKVSIT